MGGRQLLNSSSHGSQEQLTSTIRTSTDKGEGIWGAATQFRTYHGHVDLVVLRVGFKKASLLSLGILLHRKESAHQAVSLSGFTPKCWMRLLEEPCDLNTAESRSLIPRIGSYTLQGWATRNFRVRPAHWLKCQISKGTHAPHSEVLPSVCSAGLSLGLDLNSVAQLGLLP